MALLGMGGIGKTSLPARLAQTVAHPFRTGLLAQPAQCAPAAEWLTGVISLLTDLQVVPPASESQQITAQLQLRSSQAMPAGAR